MNHVVELLLSVISIPDVLPHIKRDNEGMIDLVFIQITDEVAHIVLKSRNIILLLIIAFLSISFKQCTIALVMSC